MSVTHTNQSHRSTLLDLLNTTFKYQWFIFFVVFGSVIGTGIVMFNMPDVFRSEIKLVVNNTRSVRLTAKDEERGVVSLEELVTTELEKILSDRVIDETLRLSFPGQYAKLDDEGIADWVRQVRSSLNGSSIRNSRIAYIRMIDEDPEIATTFLNHLVEAQLQLHGMAISDTLELQHYQPKIQESERLLDKYDLRIEELRTEAEIYDGTKQVATLVDAIEQNRSRLLTAQRDCMQMEVSLVSLRDGIEKDDDLRTLYVPEGALGASREMDAYMRQLDQLDNLRFRYRDDHPEVVRLSAVLEQTESSFRSQLENYLQAEGAALTAKRAEIELIQNEVSRQTAILERLPQAESELNRLLERRNNLDDLLKVLYKQLHEMEIAQISSQTNRYLEVISPASVPDEPIGPRRKLNVSLAFFLSLIIAIGLAYVFEMMSHVFETPRSVADAIGLEVLASIAETPEIGN